MMCRETPLSLPVLFWREVEEVVPTGLDRAGEAVGIRGYIIDGVMIDAEDVLEDAMPSQEMIRDTGETIKMIRPNMKKWKDRFSRMVEARRDLRVARADCPRAV